MSETQDTFDHGDGPNPEAAAKGQASLFDELQDVRGGEILLLDGGALGLVFLLRDDGVEVLSTEGAEHKTLRRLGKMPLHHAAAVGANLELLARKVLRQTGQRIGNYGCLSEGKGHAEDPLVRFREGVLYEHDLREALKPINTSPELTSSPA